MVRLSHTLIIGTFLGLLIAVVAFFGGWSTAATFGYTPIGVVVTTFISGSAGGATPADARQQFAVFWDVWQLVKQEFYHTDPLDQQRMAYGAIHGMLSSLGDDYTSFQEPDVAAQSRESMQGRFDGIGAYIRTEKGEILIDRPIKNSPALKAGLQPGDVLLKVDGEALAPLVKGLSDAEAAAKAVAKIRGPKGSSVTLTIRRPPATTTFDVTIVRDEVPLVSVYAQLLPSNVAYIQITEFKAPTASELDAALRELLPQHPRSLILDLRNNPGGFLTTAQEVLGRFYDGTALYEQTRDGEFKELKTIKAPAELQIFDVPMVVLINGGSASASEIVAGALRDRRPHTTLIGEKSYGKGSVQNVHQLRDGSSARITIAQWLTPNKSVIHKIGITPEYVVPPAADRQYNVPCTTARPPAEGHTDCSDAQLAISIRFLVEGTVPQGQNVTR